MLEDQMQVSGLILIRPIFAFSFCQIISLFKNKLVILPIDEKINNVTGIASAISRISNSKKVIIGPGTCDLN